MCTLPIVALYELRLPLNPDTRTLDRSHAMAETFWPDVWQAARGRKRNETAPCGSPSSPEPVSPLTSPKRA